MDDKDNGQYIVKYKMEQEIEDLLIYISYKDQNDEI